MSTRIGCAAFLVVPAGLIGLLSGDPRARRPAAWLASAVVAFVATAYANDRVADASLREIREALVAHHDRTGTYPEALESLVGTELDTLPRAGLPFVRRDFMYSHRQGSQPMLFSVYMVPFGRRVVHVEDGSLHVVD